MDVIQQLYTLFINGAAICTDTRTISPGSIFFALKGENFNGNQYASQALKAGAAAVVIDEYVDTPDDGSTFLVDDVLSSLQQLALYHRRQLKIPFIGITGSNGKTTTKELMSRVLGKKYQVHYTKGNLNNHIGVPLTLLGITKSHEIAVIEMGANHQKEIELLCSISRPTHVLITNVGKAHLEGFGGFEGVKKGKGEMYTFAKNTNATVFINTDNEHLKEMLGGYTMIVSYGTSGSEDVSGLLKGNASYVSLEWKTPDNDQIHNIKSHITGNYNFENILSAIAVGIHFKVTAHDICEAVETYIPDNQRSQEIKVGSNHVILDAYNANPSSMEAALTNFTNHFSGKRAVFLGDMFELGESAFAEHKRIAEIATSAGFDHVILVGPDFRKAASGMEAIFLENSKVASQWIQEHPLQNFNILIKGSRSSKMELVMEGLKATV
ncbi:MAG: UDP-N-acetylmuramoyl-tripeptide--D-alanyl-D-alanine ligase [Bacteroidetes bacterium]|nr:UDP-N-acetylmuramoyl-tripeptide--D-alanyl-D-alanine ligase [Bacteroidota bacterium]